MGGRFDDDPLILRGTLYSVFRIVPAVDSRNVIEDIFHPNIFVVKQPADTLSEQIIYATNGFTLVNKPT